MTYSDVYDPQEGIAIIGMAGRFPESPSVGALWQNLLEGRECITHFGPDARERAVGEDGAADPSPDYVCARGVLAGVDEFDEEFFGFTPREAAILDPQQRLFLQASWEAMENAGYDPRNFGGPIGVYAGATTSSYYLQNLLSRSDVTDPLGPIMLMLGNSNDYVATRVAYKFDLTGPALNIQNACSTSLVAVCAAVQSLQTYQCDMALAGGVSIMLPQRRGHIHEEGSILAPDGHCRPFDRGAAGTVSSNGLGVVVLRRLRDAIEDKDTIYAVIKGAALNNDGNAKVGFTAPSVDGHARVISMAQMLGGIDPATISYIEAHGTGTELGDPIEIAGLTQAFRAGGAEENGFCAIGSVKSNIGHLDVAAGVAGLIKATLALHHGLLPASINFESPNPKLGIESTPFFVNAVRRDWPEGTTPRRAGVSSFGLGGTNAHVVLEEAPTAPPPAAAVRPAQLLVLSARDAESLDRAAQNLKRHLEHDRTTELADIAYTLAVGRRHFGHRRSVVCRDRDAAISLLTSGDPRCARGFGGVPPVGVAFMFPGQGSQYVDMCRGLYESEPLFTETMNSCARVLRPEIGVDLLDMLYPGESDRDSAQERLTQTALTQPALFAVEYALAQVWMSWGVQPAAMIGHSLGEFVAACIAGTFARDDALRLVARRARLMESMPSGAMLGVRASAELVAAELTPDVAIAAFNGPRHIVVSGSHEAIAAFATRLDAIGVAHRALPTSHAYHSPLMESAVQPFVDLVAETPRRAPDLRWVSSLTGRPITDAEATDPWYWARQLREPVQFAHGVGALSDAGLVLVEVGPGQTLTALARQHRPNRPDQLVTTSLSPGQDWAADADHLLAAAGRLWSRGVDIDWHGVHGAPRRRVPLPTYPFRRRRHWIGPVPGPATESTPAVAEITATAGPAGNLPAQLEAVFVELSGVDGSSLTPGATFLQMGFDSLFLTQAASALQKRFATKITVRTLVEDAPTFDLLAAHILRALPENTSNAPATGITAPAERPEPGPVHGLSGTQRQRLSALVERHSWRERLNPVNAVSASGAHFRDAAGNDYIDLTNDCGTVVFGHHPAFIRAAVDSQYGAGIGAESAAALADEVADLVHGLSGMEGVAFCDSSSDAVAAAIRLARRRSGRDRIAVVDGAGHATADGSAVVLDYGTAEALQTIGSLHGQLAAVLVEPVPARRPEVLSREFLEELRAATAESDTALIFDENLTGFRAHPRGAQALFGTPADIAVYANLGAGLPIGIIAGSAEYLEALGGGTQRPLALAAARAVLRRLKEDGPALQRELNLRTTAFVTRLQEVVAEVGAPVRVNHFASWFVVSFPPELPLAPLYHPLMRAHGVHTREGEPGFLTVAHTDADLDVIVTAFGATLTQMRADGLLPERAAQPRKGRDADGREAWFVPDPERPGKYMQLVDAGAGEGITRG